MNKVVKDLNFEQIVIIYNAIADCENACYDAVIANNSKREAMKAIGDVFDKLNKVIQDISNADDWFEYAKQTIR